MTAGTRTNLAEMIIILVTRTCHCNDNSIKTELYKKPAATSKSKKRKRKSDSKKQKINSDNSLPKNDNSRMNQVEIQNDNLGPTIDQTEDMHMEKAK
jgi:hypothetical protein